MSGLQIIAWIYNAGKPTPTITLIVISTIVKIFKCFIIKPI